MNIIGRAPTLHQPITLGKDMPLSASASNISARSKLLLASLEYRQIYVHGLPVAQNSTEGHRLTWLYNEPTALRTSAR